MNQPRLPRRSILARVAVFGAVAAIALGGTSTAAFADPDPSPSTSPSTAPSTDPSGDPTPDPGSSASTPATPPSAAPGEIRGAGGINAVKDSYIVVLKDTKASKSKVTTDANGLAKTYSGKVKHVYSKAVKGFSVTMTEAQAKKLANDPAIAYVEQNHTIRKSDTETGLKDIYEPWGLDRIDQAFNPLDGAYNFTISGTTVHAYVIDTGIRPDHVDFGGRASYGYDAILDTVGTAEDCNGHGTHVAATLGGTHFGVAKGVDIVAVRVLDCDGIGTEDQVIAGIDWVTANAVKPAVANMSLGGDSISTAIDDALKASIASGVTYAVAAGNDAVNACTESPADVPEAITVGASDEADFRATFSNNGPCVDVFAPGVNIASAYFDTTDDVAYASGTSMASPHAAGVAALILAQHPDWTPAQVSAEIIADSAAGVVRNAGAGSTTRELQVPGLAKLTTFGLRSHANGQIVTAESGGTKPLIANRYNVGAWEGFDVVDAGGGYVALKAHANGKYVTAENAGAAALIARSTAIGDWEKFTLVDNADGSFSLQAVINGKYVTAENGGKNALIARGTAIGEWEKFDRTGVAAVIGLVADINGYAVTAESGGAKPLIARGTAFGTWESFDIVDVGGGYVALNSHANHKYVSADNAGKSSLIARATSVGAWEKFKLINNPDGTVSFQAAINSKYVTAESAGTKPLIARSSAIGAWEIYWLWNIG